MNKRQVKKQWRKLFKRMINARKNGESISIINQSIVWKDETKKGMPDNIERIYTHKPQIRITRAYGENSNK